MRSLITWTEVTLPASANNASNSASVVENARFPIYSFVSIKPEVVEKREGISENYEIKKNPETKLFRRWNIYDDEELLICGALAKTQDEVEKIAKERGVRYGKIEMSLSTPEFIPLQLIRFKVRVNFYSVDNIEPMVFTVIVIDRDNALDLVGKELERSPTLFEYDYIEIIGDEPLIPQILPSAHEP